MKAIVLPKAGGVENLILRDIERPKAAHGEVLVKVNAISVNPADVKVRSSDEMLTAFLGCGRPAVLGWDFAGDVAEVAERAEGFRVSDAVFGVLPTNRGGGYAEYVAVPADIITRKPSNVRYEVAAVTTMAALTAWNPIVNEARVKQGDKVLIHAGSGGVGHFAIQIAKHSGATVATTSSARNREFVLSIGADQHIDYASQILRDETGDVDFVLDTIGGETLARSIEVVRDGGKIITPLPSPDEATVEKAKERGIALSFGGMRHSAKDLGALADLLGRGALKPHISTAYSFAEMPQAAHAVGKRTNRRQGGLDLVAAPSVWILAAAEFAQERPFRARCYRDSLAPLTSAEQHRPMRVRLKGVRFVVPRLIENCKSVRPDIGAPAVCTSSIPPGLHARLDADLATYRRTRHRRRSMRNQESGSDPGG